MQNSPELLAMCNNNVIIKPMSVEQNKVNTCMLNNYETVVEDDDDGVVIRFGQTNVKYKITNNT